MVLLELRRRTYTPTRDLFRSQPVRTHRHPHWYPYQLPFPVHKTLLRITYLSAFNGNASSALSHTAQVSLGQRMRPGSRVYALPEAFLSIPIKTKEIGRGNAAAPERGRRRGATEGNGPP